MKIIYTILCAWLCTGLYAQSFLSTNTKSKVDADSYLRAYTAYDYDHQLLKGLLSDKNTSQFDLEIANETRRFAIEPLALLSSDYALFDSKGKYRSNTGEYSFYKGYEIGKPSTKIGLMLVDDELKLHVHDEKGTYTVSKNAQSRYIGYYDHSRKTALDKEWDCQVEEAREELENQYRSGTNESGCLTIFIEVDHNMYNKHGGNIANTEAWVMNIMSQVAILYIEHDIPINVSGIQVWDQTDPYISASNTNEALNLFRQNVNNNPNNNGRLAHLLSGRSLGGGIAYLGTLCSTGLNVAVSANMNSGFTPYPNYSWNVMVVAHELGHNVGSNHTHACVWNGNGTAIDGCGNVSGCPNAPIPSNGGTVMSYCHLNSVGINLANGFGPQPGALIKDRYEYANCVTGENCAPVTPFNDVCARSIVVPVHQYCIAGQYRLEAANASNVAPFTCATSQAEEDIWFSFEFPSSGTVEIELEGKDQLTDLMLEVYSGECNSLSTISCAQANSSGQISLSIPDTYINQTILLRVAEMNSDVEGLVDLCIYNANLPCDDMVDTLNQIYIDNVGANWTNNNGWSNGANSAACDFCNWHGVVCDRYGKIINIDLSNNNLTQALSAKFLDLLDLQDLNLSHNALTAMPVDQWDTLEQLFILDLRNNQINDTIPRSLRVMKKINTVHLDNNAFHSNIPPNLGYNGSWRRFTAANNNLSGCFPNGLSSFCYKDSLNLSGNANLPYGGDVSLLCSDGSGTDSDNDGHCRNIDDCNDNDNTIYYGSPEISCDGKDNNCDGTVDEGSNHGPNEWIGPNTNGDFQVATNWSLGHVPLVCEDVNIESSQGLTAILVKGPMADGYYETIRLRKLYVGPNVTMTLDTNQYMQFSSDGRFTNDGTMNIIGGIGFDYNTHTDTCGVNNGQLTISDRGNIYMGVAQELGLINSATGVIDVYGFLSVARYNAPLIPIGIDNNGAFNVYGQISVNGEYITDRFVNRNSGVLIIKENGSFYQY